MNTLYSSKVVKMIFFFAYVFFLVENYFFNFVIRNSFTSVDTINFNEYLN